MTNTHFHTHASKPFRGYRKGYRLMAALIAFGFALGPTLPLFASSDATPVPTPKTSKTQNSGASAQKKKGTGAKGSKSKGKKETATAKPKDDYPVLRIGPGDLLSIFVYGENGGSIGSGTNTQLATDYQVDSDGLIVFPFLGRVKLEGLTPAEASEKIAKLLSKPRKVSVLIKESDTFWVSILGNVGKPGRYQIAGKATLLSALAEAGGPLPGSDMGGAILIHGNMKSRMDLDKYFSGVGKIDRQPFLYPGDTLMVQRSPWPDLGTIAVIASILASGAVAAVEISSLRH